mgnify:CR=1 FL=1
MPSHFGCFSISCFPTKPGIVKGNHWHHTKNEKFVVVSGKGVIRFRKIDSDKVVYPQGISITSILSPLTKYSCTLSESIFRKRITPLPKILA